MIAVLFNKAFAESVLDAIQKGTPIPVPPGPGWTGNDMLTLAGILYAAVFSQGPHAYQAAGLPASAMAKLHGEHREAVEEDLKRDIHDAIEFINDLASQVIDGEYDANYRPELAAVLGRTADGGNVVMPAKGFKGHKDLI
jgi:hypothetical protein